MRTFAEKPKATQQTKSSKSKKPSGAFCGQGGDVQSVLHLQQYTNGDQAVQRLLQTKTENIDTNSASSTPTVFSHDFSRIPVYRGTDNTIQPKLSVNAPKDRYEQEADRIAEEVLRQKAPGEKGEKVKIQGIASQRATGDERNISEEIEKRLSQSKGSGSSLSNEVRAFVEPQMNSDFSEVRIHTDSEAAKMNQELGARAFTHERDIYFGPGQYKTQSVEGKRLIVHELTHVVQQSYARQSSSEKYHFPHALKNSTPMIQRDLRSNNNTNPSGRSAHQRDMSRRDIRRQPSRRIDGFPNIYIRQVDVNLSNLGNGLTLTWSQETDETRALPSLFPFSPGAGRCTTCCDEYEASRERRSMCTPQGTHTVGIKFLRLPFTSWARYATAFSRGQTGIAFIHSSPGPRPILEPRSHGCVRTTEEGAQIIFENSIRGLTVVHVFGRWRSALCYETTRAERRLRRQSEQCPRRSRQRTDEEERSRLESRLERQVERREERHRRRMERRLRRPSEQLDEPTDGAGQI